MKPETLQDPRVFFAAERTLLAWMRTGLTVIVVGFVVARFGLFLRLLSLESAAAQSPAAVGFSAALGVLFVLAGSIAVIVATIQHRSFVATLPASDLPPSYSRMFAMTVSGGVGVLGLLLAGYLIATAT